MNGKEQLRKLFNPAISGPNTDALLESVGTAVDYLQDNVEAVNDQLYIATAEGRYLEQRFADRGLSKPENINLSDEVFREIGIEVTNRKQVRDQILNILRIMYGEELTRASVESTTYEPFQLADGDDLIIQYDDETQVQITFDADQFSSISAATAQEVSDAITRKIRKIGRRGSAEAYNDGVNTYVSITSDTTGPSSSIRILGGRAQNILKFPLIRPTSAQNITQWTISLEAGGITRFTWTGGPNPSVGKVKKNDYVNIYGSGFNANNKGTFTILSSRGGSIGESYFEIGNPSSIVETVLQGSNNGVLFFSPQKFTLNNKYIYAALFQTENRVLEVIIPATTKVVRRERKGAAHLRETGLAEVDQYAPYIYDPKAKYTIDEQEASLSDDLNFNSSFVLEFDDVSDFPDESKFVVFDFGGKKEEGPIKYLSRPSTTSLLLDPSYKFKNEHSAGTPVTLLTQNYPYDVLKDGSDYAFYVTDVVSGRLYTEDLIKLVYATGINLVITVIYPGSIGLGKSNTPFDEKIYIWGE